MVGKPDNERLYSGGNNPGGGGGFRCPVYILISNVNTKTDLLNHCLYLAQIFWKYMPILCLKNSPHDEIKCDIIASACVFIWEYLLSHKSSSYVKYL